MPLNRLLSIPPRRSPAAASGWFANKVLRSPIEWQARPSIHIAGASAFLNAPARSQAAALCVSENV